MTRLGGRQALSPAEKRERANRVRDLRQPMTQVELAEASGLSREEIVKIETGKNAATTSRVQQGLARAFRVTAEEIADYLDGRLAAAEVRRRQSTASGSSVVALVRQMARASRFDETFLRQWSPSDAESSLEAEALWTLCRSDFIRWKISRAEDTD